ncbi:MAG: UDP-N-acetylmuramoyl-L-alanyl-D-glutamate--2,6-diaminopimelate ligase [Clostridia bacterium]|nr:UDP-N-acetylmuramoyl-L-alanyl-D-glutamate--2,6-diaminopimelate ligase [Clostridia bacterium]
MKLSDISAFFPAGGLPAKERDVEFNSVCRNSKEVKKGDVFFLFSGEEKHIKEALSNGAAAVVCDIRVKEQSVPVLNVDDVRAAFSLTVLRLCGDPQKKLRICAVTGTNGKTTTAHMLAHILRYVGYKCAVIGTTGAEFDDETLDTGYTTPPAEIMAELLKKADDENYDFVIAEASSHALAQKRLYGINFDVGIFTNLSHDHLDYHKTLKDCAEAKASLFTQCDHAVINYDDAHAFDMAWRATGSIWYFSLYDRCADFLAHNIETTANGVSFDIDNGGSTEHFSSSLYGRFSIYNMLSAASAAAVLGIKFKTSAKALESFITVDGRMEKVSGKSDISVFVDFAHTPDAMEKVLTAAREITEGKLICVFGCGGERDAEKRGAMCKTAYRNADEVIITNDNPRFEDPKKIIAQIVDGAPRGVSPVVIENRREAIEHSIELAEGGDCVMILGKGHEKYIEYRGEKIPFSDADEAKKILKEKGK